MSTQETARLISRFTAILAEEADRNDMPFLATLLRDAEAEANEFLPVQTPDDGDLCEFVVNRTQ